MKSLGDGLMRWLLFLLLGPVILACLVPVIGALLWTLLPWVLVCSVISGIAAGVSAAIVLRRRMPLAAPERRPRVMMTPQRVRRPRQLRRHQDPKP